MTKYPLTYAVFYRSIIEPHTLLHQYDVNNALFAGKIGISDTHPDYVGPIIGNGYVSGSKTIRSVLIQKIQNMPPEELVPRIRLLALRDIPAVLITIKKLLSIVDISEPLRERLYAKADTVSEELFIAEIFQLSLKCHNKKLQLKGEHKSFLNNLATTEVETSNVESKAPDVFDEIDEILNKVRDGILKPKNFDEEGDYAYWKRIHLPADFEKLMLSVAPLLSEGKCFISLDLADIRSVCHLDLDTKTCVDGHIEILEVSCSVNDWSIYSNALSQIKNCMDCILYITGGPDTSLIEVEELSHILQEHIHPDANLVYGVDLDDLLTDRFYILVVCYIKDSVKEATLSNEDVNQIIDSHMDSIQVEKTKFQESTKEIQIPNFFRK